MDLSEKTIESKRIYEGKIINLRVDTVELPNGKISKREVVEHKGAVAIVPMLTETEMVLVRQFRVPAGRTLLEIPAGGLEIGEHPTECAKRELAEEIGYTPGKLSEMFYSYLAPGYSDEKLHMFLAEDLSPKSLSRDTDEFLEIVHVTVEEAVELIRSGEIADAKSISGILFASCLLKRCIK